MNNKKNIWFIVFVMLSISIYLLFNDGSSVENIKFFIIGIIAIFVVIFIIIFFKNKSKNTYLENDYIDKNRNYESYQNDNYKTIEDENDDIYYWNYHPYKVEKLKQKISKILENLIEYKSEYKIKKDINSKEFLDQYDKDIDLDLVLYKIENPYLIVKIENHTIKKKNTYTYVKNYFENKNVKFLTFYTHLPNTENYIKARLKDNLKDE